MPQSSPGQGSSRTLRRYSVFCSCPLCFLRSLLFQLQLLFLSASHTFLLFKDESDTMHPLFVKADRLSGEVIGATVEVHRIARTG